MIAPVAATRKHDLSVPSAKSSESVTTEGAAFATFARIAAAFRLVKLVSEKRRPRVYEEDRSDFWTDIRGDFGRDDAGWDPDRR
jgi:hypothetical protein